LGNPGGSIDAINYEGHRNFNWQQAELALTDNTFSDKCGAATNVRVDALF
jgi:hypothetical protein